MHAANIFNIQRFSIHDGPGIRTVVFFKGCPLECLWCSNPESQNTFPQLSVIKNNCIGCGACMPVCPRKAITVGEKGPVIDRELCVICGACAEECYTRALKMMGEKISVRKVLDEIGKDAAFYRNSGGGYTLSGGEPLVYVDFCLELVDLCDKEGFSGAIETSGYGNTEKLKELSSKLDLVFYDIKHINDEKHQELTGVSNKLILTNLKEIQKSAKEIIVRTPLIPGINDDDENIKATAKLCGELENVKTWEILPYHRLGEHKYEALGEEYGLKEVVSPKVDKIAGYEKIANSILSEYGKKCEINRSAIG